MAEGSKASKSKLAAWRGKYPTVASLEPVARRRVPYFVFDFLQGGTGDEVSRPRNHKALAEIEIVPRYCTDVSGIDTAATLFGRRYSAPLVMAPIGMDGAIWPGATRHLAAAAQEMGLAHMSSTMATASIEDVAAIAPDSAWFQLYGIPGEDHRISFDLMRRADEAGAHVLAVTVDIPLPARRVRDMRNGVSLPFSYSPKAVLGTLMRPRWLAALVRHGMPSFPNFAPYGTHDASGGIHGFVAQSKAGSGIDWDLLARMRDRWPRALVVKGILHPDDARRAKALGMDGIIVSNHGGRQFDAAPAPVDLVPVIREAVSDDMTVLMDGGIMSGLDMAKAMAVGADGVLVGRGFMLGLAALGQSGAHHVASILMDEFRIALGQTGACGIEGLRSLSLRQPGRWHMKDFGEEAEGMRQIPPAAEVIHPSRRKLVSG